MRGSGRASSLRQPVAAGIFYPGEERPLAGWVDRLMKGPGGRAVAVIVPHGGYASPSGAVAGLVYGKVRMPEVAVILGPDHSGLAKPFGIQMKGQWMTPLGKMSIDEPLAKAIRRAVPDLESDPVGHREEHSIEVQLPFLQRIKAERRIKAPRRIPAMHRFIPILCGTPPEVPLRRIGEGLARAIERVREKVLLIMTTNLSHEEPIPEGKRKDERTIERILAMDDEGLMEAYGKREISICGAGAVAVGIAAAKALGAARGTLVAYRSTEGLTGESDSATGYAGMILQ